MTRLLRRADVALVVLAALAVALPAPVRADDVAPGQATTTTSSTTSTVVPTATTTGAGGATTTSTTPTQVPDQPGDAGGEAPVEEVPPAGVSVPPPPAAPPPPPTGLVRVVQSELRRAQSAAAAAEKAQQAATRQVGDLEGELAAINQQLASLRHQQAEAVARLLRARDRVRRRAVAAYTGGDIQKLDVVLASDDINELLRGFVLVQGAIQDGQDAVRDYRRAKEQLGQAADELVARADALRAQLATAQQVAAQATTAAQATEIDLTAVAAGSAIVIRGFVFPVAGPHRFGNDFGAPRLVGTPLFHWHQGNDIFALGGTPLVACERGVVVRMGTDRLGGTKLWLVGASGTAYYYAHLTGYAPGVVEGLLVEAGTVLGFVGNTGDARGGPTHLHFEVHPQGGPAVNPYPLLKAVDSIGSPVTPVYPTTTTAAVQ